jgi:hypothetical protein
MPRWLAVLIGVMLFCVVTTVGGGYVLVRWAEGEMSEPVERSISDSVETAVLGSIRSQDPGTNTVRVSQFDLDINTEIGPPGESGFEVIAMTGEDLVTIYGASTIIDRSGIEVVLADVEYHALPVVENGRVELELIGFEKGLVGWIFPSETFDNGFEMGINSALAKAGLKPVEIELATGHMTITTEPLGAK